MRKMKVTDLRQKNTIQHLHFGAVLEMPGPDLRTTLNYDNKLID